MALAVSLPLAFTVAYAFLWPRAAWYLIPARDLPVVNRALGDAISVFSMTADDARWKSRPTIVRYPDRTCVSLGSWQPRAHGYWGYRVCYDARTGETLDERASVD